MTPAGDVASRRAKDETFSMANVVPQTPALNRGVWEGIESAVRHLAEKDDGIFIVTGPLLRPGGARTNNGRVEIPSATWKAIYDPSTSRSGAWICKNIIAPDCRTVSISTLAKLVGVNPFPALSPAEAAATPDLPTPERSRYWPPR
jgi:endonuclease G